MATTLVCLHALGASGASFDGVAAALGDGFACSAPDLPGFGDHAGAARTDADATLDWLVDRIAERATDGYLLVGHSMGGKFATLLAARAEAGDARLSGCAGVVLVAASPPAPEPMEEDRRTAMLGWVANSVIGEADAVRFVEANIAAPLPQEAMARMVADVRRSSPAAWRAWLERGAQEDRSAEVGRLLMPALIVAGGADGDLGLANQRRLNLPHYLGARVEVVADAAHLIPYERPGALARLIRDFVSRSA